MTENVMHQCPADGCDYEGLFHPVCAHYSGKRDAPHSGGFEKAKNLLENGEANLAETSSETSFEGDPQPSSETKSSEPSSGNLAFPSNPDQDPTGEGGASSRSGGSSSSDDVSCPGCGETEELYAATAVLRSPLRGKLATEHVELLRESDAMCMACGGVFDE